MEKKPWNLQEMKRTLIDWVYNSNSSSVCLFRAIWLAGEKFYTSVNSMSGNLRTTFLSSAPKMYNNVDKIMILMTKWELYGMNYYFCGFYRCVYSGESLTNFT